MSCLGVRHGICCRWRQVRLIALNQMKIGFSRLQGFKMRSCTGYGSSWVISIKTLRALGGGTNGPQFWAPGNFELFVLAERAPKSTLSLGLRMPVLTGRCQDLMVNSLRSLLQKVQPRANNHP